MLECCVCAGFHTGFCEGGGRWNSKKFGVDMEVVSSKRKPDSVLFGL